MPDELETILRLVAEGTLSAEDAAPIIEAISRGRARDEDPDDSEDATGRAGHRAGRVDRHLDRAHRHLDRAFARAEARMAESGAPGRSAGGRQLRIRVTEHGRQVVNLRIPIGFVDAALGIVPGLGGDQAARIRDAVRSGVVGPIIDVDDPDGGGVLISVE